MTKGIPQLKLFAARFRAIFDRAIDERIMRAMGEEAARIIVRRTRLGQTAKRTEVTTKLGEIKTAPKKLEALSGKYIKFRKKHRRHLFKLTNATRSNLTFSGQLLASIGVVRSAKSLAVVGANNDMRRDAITGDATNLTNAELSKHVSDAGRPFLVLSKKDDEKLVRFYRRQFGDLVRRSGVNR